MRGAQHADVTAVCDNIGVDKRVDVPCSLFLFAFVVSSCFPHQYACVIEPWSSIGYATEYSLDVKNRLHAMLVHLPVATD